MKGTVICDIQVVLDSATNLIENTFTFDKVGNAASEKAMGDMKKVLSRHTFLWVTWWCRKL